MTRKLFGTDGVRGTANRDPMTSEVALQLGRAAAHVFRRGARRHTIVIGKDTRLSGYMLETALASGICSMGVNVMLVGPLPTPGIAFITRQMRADAGVVISASHNPYQDNGIKFFDRDGFKLPDAIEQEMETLIASNAFDHDRPTADAIGKAQRIDDAAGRYITYLKTTIPAGMMFEGVKIVLDCGHGAAYRVAPAVFTELGATVIPIGVQPDGRNINDACGSLHPDAMIRAVREQGAHVGCAFDGDADRVIMCDHTGAIVDGDAMLALAAYDLQERGALKKNTVVGTSMCNVGLDACLQKRGIALTRTDVGDRYVIEAMREGAFNLGGEPSGHLIFLDNNTTGDGVLGALQMLSIMQRTGKNLRELAAIFTPFPQILTSVRVREKRPIGELPRVTALVASIEKELGAKGRIVVRYSGTESVARVMIEGENEPRIRALADDVIAAITTEVGA